MDTIKKKMMPDDTNKILGDEYDFNNKILKTAWHPSNNTIAVSCLNGLYFYNIVDKKI